ncbi:hypothetical protein ACFVHB_08005 [Kitasatospora sp. NPDC127111]|uniref:hypothetical protein n=1 Tax=Kitasatospora sp. NPDC127111 TaxID=3345363 RepID=UPI003628B7A4
MDTSRGKRITADERREREQAWSAEQKKREKAWTAEQKKREKAWTAEFEKRRQARETEDRERELRTSIAAERETWASGSRAGRTGFIDVAGPDGTVRIAVVWLGRFGATARPLNDYSPLRHVVPDGEGILLLIPVALLVGLNFGLRWLALALLGRPRWAVAAKAGPDRGGRGGNTVLLRTRDRSEALKYAAALADRVEQDGTAALRSR